MKNRHITGRRVGMAGVILLLVVIFSGCQAIFTYSPVAFLKRNPANLTADEQIQYAEYALAGEDEEAIAAIYDVLKVEAADSTDAELNFMAAQLALDLSGMPEVLDEILTSFIDLGISSKSTADFSEILDQALELLSTDYATLIDDAIAFLEVTSEQGPELLSSYFVIAGGFSYFVRAFNAADGVLDNIDINSDDVQAAYDFVTNGIDALPDDDPDKAMLEGIISALDSLFA